MSVDVIHEKTFETYLVPWRRSASCVMNNGDIALWGKTGKKDPREFHIYNKDRQRQEVKKIKALCPHKNVRILSIVIENVENLAASCTECGDINLQHLTIDTAYPAFSSDLSGPMCYGKEGKIFSINCIEEFPIIEIGCKRKQFVYGETYETKMKTVYDVCYISTRDILVIATHKKDTKDTKDLRVILADKKDNTLDDFSDEEPDEDSEKNEKDKKKEAPAIIRAIQGRYGKVVWEVKEVDGVETRAHGVIYSHKYNVLLVADGSNRRILVLQPESGEHLQTIDLSSDVHSAWQLFMHRDQLILVHHGRSRKINLSYYTVSLIRLFNFMLRFI